MALLNSIKLQKHMHECCHVSCIYDQWILKKVMKRTVPTPSPFPAVSVETECNLHKDIHKPLPLLSFHDLSYYCHVTLAPPHQNPLLR